MLAGIQAQCTLTFGSFRNSGSLLEYWQWNLRPHHCYLGNKEENMAVGDHVSGTSLVNGTANKM